MTHIYSHRHSVLLGTTYGKVVKLLTSIQDTDGQLQDLNT